MSSSRSTNSPRVKAHKLKVAGTKKQGSPSPKRLKQRKILLSTTEDDDDDLESLSASLSTYGSVGGYSSNIIGSRLEAPSPETNSPQAPPSMMVSPLCALQLL